MAVHQNGSPPKNEQYHIATLPKTGPTLKLCIERYRKFRLELLESSPGVFAGSFEVEKDLPESHFENIMAHPRRRIVVAVEAGSSGDQRTDEEALTDGVWAAIVHIKGPVPLSEWTWPNIGGLRSDGEEVRWEIFNAYIAPKHRTGPLSDHMESAYHGVCVEESKRLLLSQDHSSVQRSCYVRQRLAIAPKARKLAVLYKKGSWQEAGFITAIESVKAKELGYTYSDEEIEHGRPERLVMERVTAVELKHSESQANMQTML